jgi:hypothetical protein
MKVRYEFTQVTNLEQALHDTLLKFNHDLADCLIALEEGSVILFKPRQVSSSTQKALEDEHAAVEVDLPEFLRLLSSMVQMSDGHVMIRRSTADPKIIFDLRVADSSFALVETDNHAILQAFELRLKGARRSETEF